MGSEIEAVADIATGSVLANAFERDSGQYAPGEGKMCLNCSAPLAGPFCAQCGQKGDPHRTLAAIGHDLLHGVFHLEGKIWHTLPLLAWRPGELTRHYVHGQRARFISPLALFLFSVFLMFAVFKLVGGPIAPAVNVDGQRTGSAEIAAELRQTRADIARLEREMNLLPPQSAAARDARERLSDARSDEKALAIGLGVATRGASDALAINKAEVDTGNATLDAKFRAALGNPKLLLYKVQANAYKFSWVLIPLSIPFLWLLFPFSRTHHIYDHAVFITYSLSFMTLLLVAMSCITALGGESITGLLLVTVPPVHMYRQLKGAYLLGRLAAVWRTVALLLSAVSALALFLAGLVLLGLAG